GRAEPWARAVRVVDGSDEVLMGSSEHRIAPAWRTRVTCAGARRGDDMGLTWGSGPHQVAIHARRSGSVSEGTTRSAGGASCPPAGTAMSRSPASCAERAPVPESSKARVRDGAAPSARAAAAYM